MCAVQVLGEQRRGEGLALRHRAPQFDEHVRAVVFGGAVLVAILAQVVIRAVTDETGEQTMRKGCNRVEGKQQVKSK